MIANNFVSVYRILTKLGTKMRLTPPFCVPNFKGIIGGHAKPRFDPTVKIWDFAEF